MSQSAPLTNGRSSAATAAGRVKVGDLIQWTINVTDQFDPPKKVMGIDPTPDGQLSCEVEGESSRAPLAQCTVVEEELSPLDTSLRLHDLDYWPLAVWPAGAMRPSQDEPTTGKEPIDKNWGLDHRTRRWLESMFRKYPGRTSESCSVPSALLADCG
jgi:hypothetical protein